MSIINTYWCKNSEFLEIEKMLKKYVNIYNKKIEFCLIICKWKLHLTDTIIHVKSEKLYDKHRDWDLRRYLITKIEYYSRNGYNFSHVSEMNSTFITDLRNMTYEHHLKQPQPVIEWVLKKIWLEIQNV